MGTHRIEILRDCDAAKITSLRGKREFFWADLAVAGGPTVEQIATAFELPEGAAQALINFEPGGSPARRIHVEADLLVFPFWCAANPDAAGVGDADALGIFRVNVLLHGDFLLTIHEHPFDLPEVVAEGRIAPGRSERYAVYVALDGMTNTVLEAVAGIEGKIAELDDLGAGQRMKLRAADQELIQSLRAQLTSLRLRLGPERALFERVGEEIEQVASLEDDRHRYFERIEAQLDRAVDRIDAARQALSTVLQAELNDTTYRLTLIATIFLPLTFLAGFFGMNFGWMVDQIDSAAAFWLLGVVLIAVAGLAFTYLARVTDRS